MKLEMESVENAGDLSRERVIFTVSSDTTLDTYVVLACSVVKVDNKGTKGAVVGALPGAYWFGGADVKKGDYVVLYTKHGSTSEKSAPTGRKSHFFYWNRNESLWGGDKEPLLIQMSNFEMLDDESDLTVEPMTRSK